MDTNLELLGFTREELQDRVVTRLCDSLMHTESGDDEGRCFIGDSDFARKLNEQVKKLIDAEVVTLADKHVKPHIETMFADLVMQETTKWGEKKGEPLTFIEYLTKRADAYYTEEVNHSGKTKSEDSYNWTRATTRGAYMIDKHLQYSIETAMKNALANANSAIVGGLKDAVTIKLEEVAKALKVSVTTK